MTQTCEVFNSGLIDPELIPAAEVSWQSSQLYLLLALPLGH